MGKYILDYSKKYTKELASLVMSGKVINSELDPLLDRLAEG